MPIDYVLPTALFVWFAWLFIRWLSRPARPHDPIGKCWCLEVHALPPYPKVFPAQPPPKAPIRVEVVIKKG